ncbi:hypothetical protein [Curtobacterium sp. ZW137]|uniref:rhamnosyltransferase WsaF family glycosyltransferase n=1 Tax=Curtobacterium sp. ZW137 TaxID=2485104 RepID=UPI000F4BD27E|nr:hypothetical protein [Curtobacterium sp. ZW137]ROP65172.1 glycosyltransferase involved in cell wall biosynthesis [Curtobacterium sp. ZW137]
MRNSITHARRVARLAGVVADRVRARRDDRRAADAERSRAPRAALVYDGVTDRSLVLAGIEVGERHPEVVLVIDEVRRGAAFAGVQTALAAAIGYADRTGRDLRVVMTRSTSRGNSAERAAALIAERFPGRFAGRGPVEVVTRESIPAAVFAADTVWIATYWKTAHALDVAARAGVVDPRRVVYLVQDHEPGFQPWSTAFAVASSTYRAGFTLCVNSEPVAAALRQTEGVAVASGLVFAPELDRAGIDRAAAVRAASTRTAARVLFYARPSKPRNMYVLGVAALAAAAAQLRDAGVIAEFVSAGEQHEAVELGTGDVLRSLGTLDWNSYFEVLGETDVVLSLQQSPHPSHPPLDAAESGARVVTNDLGGARAGLHPSIGAVPADPATLGTAVARAVLAGLGMTSEGAPAAAERVASRSDLGRPLTDVLDELAMSVEPGVRLR